MCSDCYKEHTLINGGQDKNYFRKLRIKLCPEYREEIQQQKKASRERNIEQAMLTSAKNRAARKGLEFNLELSDIVIPEKCPLLELKNAMITLHLLIELTILKDTLREIFKSSV